MRRIYACSTASSQSLIRPIGGPGGFDVPLFHFFEGIKASMGNERGSAGTERSLQGLFDTFNTVVETDAVSCYAGTIHSKVPFLIAESFLV